jgi:hypothetical protein
VQFRIEWEPVSLQWLETLPQRFQAAVAAGAQEACRDGLHHGLRHAQATIPVFEGWARDALGIFGGRMRLNADGGMVSGSIGFVGNKVIVDPTDVLSASTPFNYGWAKEKEHAAGPHQVWLYNPRTGQSTANRAKLVRWLKRQGGAWAALPDAPTRETWNKQSGEGFPPPWVHVDPGKTATPYLSDITGPLAQPILSAMVGQLWTHIEGVWR